MSYEIIEQFNADQIQDLRELYKLSWWGNDREIPDIKIMLDNSDINLGICEKQSQKLVGFTRVLTDYIYRATLWDVMVAPNYQKQGLGSQLMNEILHHSKLKNVEVFILICLPDMIPYYEKFGFTNHDGKYQFMTCDGTVSY
ncbi:GNAT family N-acetyltransferase [Crocosphaera sp. Alani8]|uniref:GNAT family N-acetyltransferase n=1 Tax=Crocosphaera sp. Alani8 TaxID=3038952 RepID=UPI00313EFA63